jgi:hypothetical protein
MNRERALKVVLVLVGLLFSAGVYPLMTSLWQANHHVSEGDQMIASIYVTLGIFLLLAARNPSANRSLIASAWSSFAHGAVMAVLAFQIPSERGGFLVAVAALVVIGIALIALAPAKQSGEREPAAAASNPAI